MIIQNRREFLKMLALAGAASPLSRLLSPSIAYALGGNGAKNLIVINLEGGFDALAAFPYYADPRFGPNDSRNIANYLKNTRPNIFTLPASTLAQANAGDFNLRANNYMGFAPALTPLKNIYDAGGMAIIQRVGTQLGAGNGSHDLGQNIYSYGRRDFVGSTSHAWFGALIEQMGLEANQAYGFGSGGRPDFITQNPAFAPAVGLSTEALEWNDTFSSNRNSLNSDYARRLAQASAPSSEAQRRIKDSLMGAFDTATGMSAINTATNPGGAKALIGNYPNDGGRTLGAALRSVARIIAYNQGDNRSRLFYTLQGGFDTHSAQGGFAGSGTTSGLLHDNLSHVAQSINALVTDLKNPIRYAWANTVIVLISEFGRTVKANGGGGTDHGAGYATLVMGGPVHGGVFGNMPDQSSMYDRNIVMPDLEFQNLLVPAVRWFGGNTNALFPQTTYTYNSAVADALI